MKYSRRTLLEGSIRALATGAALTASGTPGAHGAAADAHRPAGTDRLRESYGMLVDLTECVGCRSCAYACDEANGLHGDPESQELSAQQVTVVREVPVAAGASPGDDGRGSGDGDGDGDGAVRYVRFQCFHCLEPACASACPVAALHKTPDGPVVYDADRCIGCRYCMVACPFHVPRYQWDRPWPAVAKCVLCAPRLSRGEMPACAQACPTGATTFGKRAELVAEARRRLAAHPERYVPHIYGLHEAGGTSWLFLSDVPFEQLGFPQLDERPVPERTAVVMNKVPALAVGVAGLMALAYWLEGGRADHGAASPSDSGSDCGTSSKGTHGGGRAR